MTEDQVQPQPDPGNSDPSAWTQDLSPEEVERAKSRLEEELKGEEV